MYCNKCGAKNRDDTRTCVICGEKLPKPAPQVPAPSGPSSNTAPATPTAAPGPTSIPDFSPAPNAAEAPPQPINSYLVPAILTTLFCCLPLGIVSVIFAAQVSGKVQAGDVQGALDSSNKAKTWAWISFGVGLALFLFYVAAGIIAGVMGA